MAHFVRPRGQRFELRVRHALLPRPFYATFPDAAAASSYGQQLDAMLDRGIVPQELLAPEPRSVDDPILAAVVRGYINTAGHLTPSDDKLLGAMLPELAGLRVSSVTYRWAQDWVRGLKLRANLAPGTVRKRVGALARVLDWHLAHAVRPGDTAGAAVNPLRLLPRGYAQATEAEQRQMIERGLVVKADTQRDRRLLPGEEVRLFEVLAGAQRAARERAWCAGGDPALALFLHLIIGTGLRLREAYRLRADQVDLQRWVIRVEGSKGERGRLRPRVVPIVPALRQPLAAWCAGRVGLLWPYWSGEPADLDPATRRLSARFRSLADYAGLADITEHDLRHEAACRWFELRDQAGRWVFSDVEVARIMGWSNLAMALRYASLRGEDLAARLG